MANQTQADGGTQRITDHLSLAEVEVGDRIDPQIVPRNEHVSVGDSVDQTPDLTPDDGDDRTYDIEFLAKSLDSWGDIQTLLVYQPSTDLFAVLSGHTKSGAMNQVERDLKVRAVGSEIVVESVDELDVPKEELSRMTEQEYVDEWVDVLVGEWMHGEAINELEDLGTSTLELRDPEGRTASISYTLGGA